MRVMGFDEESIEQVVAQYQEAPLEDAEFEVYEDNWDSCQLFLSVQTQWQWVNKAKGVLDSELVRSGLSYSGVESVMRLLGMPRRSWRQLFVDLQVMEFAVLEGEAQLVD